MELKKLFKMMKNNNKINVLKEILGGGVLLAITQA